MQAINAKIGAGKGANDIAMDNSPLEIINGIASISLRLDSREITEEATCERITSSRWIDNFLQG